MDKVKGAGWNTPKSSPRDMMGKAKPNAIPKRVYRFVYLPMRGLGDSLVVRFCFPVFFCNTVPTEEKSRALLLSNVDRVLSVFKLVGLCEKI